MLLYTLYAGYYILLPTNVCLHIYSRTHIKAIKIYMYIQNPFEQINKARLLLQMRFLVFGLRI